MNRKTCFGCILAILLFSPSLVITLDGSENKNRTDSILNIIESAKGVDKLQLLDQYSYVIYDNPHLIPTLEKEAIEQSDHLYAAYAYRFKIYYFLKDFNIDSLGFYLDLIEDELHLYELKKTKRVVTEKEMECYNSVKEYAFALKISTLLDSGKYELALMAIEEVLAKAKLEENELLERQGLTYLGYTYLLQRKWREALKSFKSANFVNEEIVERGNSKLGRYSFYTSVEPMIYCLEKLGNHKEVIAMSDSLVNKIDKEYETISVPPPEEIFIRDFMVSKAYSLSSLSYVKMGELKEAKRFFDQMNELISRSDIQPEHLTIYYEAKAEYYIATKQFGQARENITKLVEANSKINDPFTIIETNLLLAKVLNAEGNGYEACDLMLDTFHKNDSITQSNFSSQVAEIQAVYQVEKAELQAIQSHEKLKLIGVILIAILLLFFLSLYLLYQSRYRRKILKEKNTQLYNQYLKIQESNKIMHKLQLEKLETTVPPNDPYDIIINNLEDYLSESEAYKNPLLSREELALAIGTNRQYLIQAIKEKTGYTFNEFIYKHRLKFAYDKIINERDQSISEIFTEAGFSARVTFNKVFKKAYGMNPSELREVLSDIEKSEKSENLGLGGEI